MITAQVPSDWRVLQSEVAGILVEAGFAAEVEMVLPLARGNAEIDVYAEEIVSGRRYVVLVECKRWNSAIPQTVVHAFRTIVSDSGANIGYIVASTGYQSGAHEAAALTNVSLVTWEEFQATFEPAWLQHHLLPTMEQRLKALWTFTEPIAPVIFLGRASRAGAERLEVLWEKYTEPAAVLNEFTQIGRQTREGPVPPLPLRAWVPTDVACLMPDAVLDAHGYREFLHAALEYGETAIDEFRDARDAS
jgi:restriction system protein